MKKSRETKSSVYKALLRHYYVTFDDAVVDSQEDRAGILVYVCLF